MQHGSLYSSLLANIIVGLVFRPNRSSDPSNRFSVCLGLLRRAVGVSNDANSYLIVHER